MPAESACTLLACSWNRAAMEINSSRTLGLLVSLACARQTAASLRRSSTLSDIARRHADWAHRYAKCLSLVPETTSRAHHVIITYHGTAAAGLRTRGLPSITGRPCFDTPVAAFQAA